MANLLYPKFKEALLNKECDLNSDDIKASLLDGADYTYAVGHVSYGTDVPAAAKVAASAALTTPTITSGAFNTDDFSWSSVSGDPSDYIVLWDDTHASDQLVAYYDTVTGLPVTPNGGNINVTVDASGWFSL